MKDKTILVVDDDESMRRVLEYNITEEGYRLLLADSAKRGLELFKSDSVDLVITDLKMPDMSGIDLMRKIRAVSPSALIIVITAYGTVDSAVESMKLGAFDYISKPFNREELKVVVKKALAVGDLMLENRHLREMVEEKYSFENMKGASPEMEDIFRLASHVARSDATVLLLGESGTGKELIARGIHLHSRRRDNCFITVNCGALPENLIESELFGHRKGAFTGALSDKKGKFELADGGTIFLDEIGELRSDLQVRLLRVLHDGVIDKVGETELITVDVRVIAATNRDLEKEVEEGNFREDLYYRLCVVPIKLPPLRNRRDDIPLLVEHFLTKHSGKMNLEKVNISKEALSLLVKKEWPGNVRELENLIERMVVMNRTGLVTEDDLPSEMKSRHLRYEKFLPELPEDGINLYKLEKELIERAYEKCLKNQSRTANYLGITRNTLLYRMEKYGIEKH